MKLDITPEQALLMRHACDLAINQIEDELRKATPKNRSFCEKVRFYDHSPPFRQNEARYILTDSNSGRECKEIPRRLAKLMASGILERLNEYRVVRSSLYELSETPISVRSLNSNERDELK